MRRKKKFRDEAMAKLKNDYLLGCDPEVVVLDASGRIVNMRDILSHEGEVGYDHNGDVVEFRPEPAKGTYTLVKRLKYLVDVLAEKVTGNKVLAGAYRAASPRNIYLGGHVHLDTMLKFVDNASNDVKVKGLDLVAEHMERLEILPRSQAVLRRQHSTYGKFGDVRTIGQIERVPNGYNLTYQVKRFEYRTLPSWMFSPKVTFACLTAAKFAAIDPARATEMLGSPSTASWKKFKEWIESYKKDDINAKRMVEKFERLNQLVGDPDRDVREAWEGKLGF